MDEEVFRSEMYRYVSFHSKWLSRCPGGFILNRSETQRIAVIQTARAELNTEAETSVSYELSGRSMRCVSEVTELR